MKSLFYSLIACIDSQFVGMPFLKKWTESLIIKSKTPQDWLIDLTMCSDSDAALNVLAEYLILSGEVLDEEYGDILVGFLYLGHIKNILTLEKFLTEVLDVVDAYEIYNLEVDDLLQVLKKDNTMSEDLRGLLLEKFGKYGERSNSLYNSSLRA